MLPLLQFCLKALEVGIGLLNTNKAAFPGTKPQHHDSQENKRDPTSGCFGPLHHVCQSQNEQRRYCADDGANFCGMHNVAFQHRCHFMQAVQFYRRIIIAQYMNLRSVYTVTLQFIFYFDKIG